MTIKVTVTRRASEDWGTPGRMTMEREDGSTFECDTLELPWAGNERGRSCIHADTYSAKMWESPHLGSPHNKVIEREDGTTFDFHRKVYRLEDKHGRRDVLVHNANFAGEVNLGEETQLHGCTAPGKGFAELERNDGVDGKQMAIISSVATLERLFEFTKGEDLEITYAWEDGAAPADDVLEAA